MRLPSCRRSEEDGWYGYLRLIDGVESWGFFGSSIDELEGAAE
jgi:hypothetical protein